MTKRTASFRAGAGRALPTCDGFVKDGELEPRLYLRIVKASVCGADFRPAAFVAVSVTV